jgi:hypothetical protein
MKKLATAVLLLVYFTVTTGFVVSVHYCMNKVDSVELGYAGAEECGKCGMNVQTSDGCCKDDVKVIKMQVDQNLAKIAVPNFTLSPFLFAVLAGRFPDFLLTSISNAFPFSNGPPLSKQNSYLLHCVFRL